MAELPSTGRSWTRDEVLAAYRPIRASIQHILRVAPRACGKPDLMRAGKQLGIWDDGAVVGDDEALVMMADVALFEPNQRRRRAYDTFLAKQALRLGPAGLELARRMAGAWFSIFRVEGRHEAAGVRLLDMLGDDRRLWLVDEGLEASAPEDAVVGLRVFDAGPFHAGFGIVTLPDEETVEFCLDAKARGVPPPFRQSLAATLYGDALRVEEAVDEEDVLDAMAEMLDAIKALADRTPERRRKRVLKPSKPGGG